MPAKLRSIPACLVVLLSIVALAACASTPDAASPKAGSGPLASCCEVIPGRLSQAEAAQLAAVVLTPEQAAAQSAQIAALRAAKDACGVELTKPERDDAAGLAAVKKAAGDYDLGLNVSECK